MYWACDRCDTLHTQNPETCRNCEHHVLRPVDTSELRQRSSGTDAPETVELEDDQTVGTTPEPDYASSPDVQVDGSVAECSDSPEERERESIFGRLRAWLPF